MKISKIDFNADDFREALTDYIAKRVGVAEVDRVHFSVGAWIDIDFSELLGDSPFLMFVHQRVGDEGVISRRDFVFKD